MQLMSAYIEVQYHGDLKVGRDVVMVVLCESDLSIFRSVLLRRAETDEGARRAQHANAHRVHDATTPRRHRGDSVGGTVC